MSCKRKPGLVVPFGSPTASNISNKSPASPEQDSPTVPSTQDNPAAQSDQVMMEAPDSPPETSHVPQQSSNQSQSSGSAQQANTSGRVNGDSGTKVNFGAPGSSWQTKKFNDEYEKTESMLLDRQWESELCFFGVWARLTDDGR